MGANGTEITKTTRHALFGKSAPSDKRPRYTAKNIAVLELVNFLYLSMLRRVSLATLLSLKIFGSYLKMEV